MKQSFPMQAIGVVHSTHADKFSTPRQPFVTDNAPGSIELFSGHNFEDAVVDLESFTHIWILFVFDQNKTWHPKVMPPHGSENKRGVFATRSPHRPNPIGMSVVRLLSVQGLTLRVEGIDMLEGTPVLDIKPYIPMADSVPEANKGWLDPQHAIHALVEYDVVFSANATMRLDWWREHTGEILQDRIHKALATAPTPHAFRKIRKGPNNTFILALPDWRVHFSVHHKSVHVLSFYSAHKQSHFDQDPSLTHHKAFSEVWGPSR